MTPLQGDQTAELEPTFLVDLLDDSGFQPPRMYHPAVGRVIGLHARPPTQTWAPFTFFAFELRRLLEETKALAEPFSITYARLPGVGGDEVWRADASVNKTTAVFDPSGNLLRCTTIPTSSKKGKTLPCAPEELARLPPLPWYAPKTMLFLPYPVLIRNPVSGASPPNPMCFGP